MTVGTPTNNRIIANLLVALYTALTNQCYAVFVTVQRLWIPERRMATYPDIMVMSEPLTYQERRTDTFNYDQEDKFTAYRTIPTFQEYLLISQEKCYIEQFQKEGDCGFLKAYKNPPIITLKYLRVEVEIADIYNNVIFDNS